MTNSTKHYFVAITQNTRTVITRTDKCLVCGDDTYWSDDPDPVCKTCASNPENIARMLAEARDQLALSEASKTLAANELRELRAALDEAKRVATGQAFRADQFKAALERALALLERVAAWRSGAVGAEWTANLSADIAAFIYQPAKDGSGGAA